ncbi:NADPH-dependent fmn FAD containing oxidoreductase [Grosmannia clavigera kw1407]|uniref:NADPH-dependent fmn FAD containing oxidoreductase n=1 Tax=Grosmannia clavigera (strain kw1407 / UAMH 11150) TaxID=655863 RepID=F0XGP3_GROCL|nr:NADPH-dependent fmn FAD containing oxidoreductase [Grosmannia clavigera kw1407]EFX02709.1 NADPH-dependent fmn FAD containing oxidoreductase [Grosmannia clavigera kw1407]
MALSERRILILYGSETGNAQEKAGEIDRLCQRLRFSTELEEMDGIKLNTLLSDFSLVIFVISTTGQGQFPKNALGFWKSLRRAKLPPNCLSSVRFTTFGLGDSSYQKCATRTILVFLSIFSRLYRYNWASRLLRSRLLHLGAQEVFDRGEADERHEDGIYQPWVQNLREYLLSSFPLPASIDLIPADHPLPPRYSLRIMPKMELDTPDEMPIDSASAAQSPDLATSIFIANRERNAALSHVERPRSRHEQDDEDWDRIKRNLAVRARQDTKTAPVWLGSSPVDILDKANILKDAPEKYLLHKSPATPAPIEFPKAVISNIPGTSLARVISNTRVTPLGHWQDVRLLTLEVAIPIMDNLKYSAHPGDVIVLYPQNYPKDVQNLIDMMEWGAAADAKMEFVNGYMPKGFRLQEGATLRDILTNNIDFTAVPTRMFLEKLADFATNGDQKEKLLELVMPQFSNEFYDFTSRPRRTILEVLAEFYSAKIPVTHVPDMFPIIRGREYSIANGGCYWNKVTIESKEAKSKSSQHPERGPKQASLPRGERSSTQSEPTAYNPQVTGLVTYRFELLIALVEYKTIIRKPRQGLCSHYIKHLPVGTPLRVGIKNQTPPPNGHLAARRPLIAIAAGTGIAPIRSLIHDRSLHDDVAETLLFFGCRNEAADFYFSEEWDKTKALTVIPAFSRDPKTDSKAALFQQQKMDDLVGNTSDHYLRMQAGLPPLDALSTSKLSYAYDEGKNYVQQLIRRHSEKVCKLLAQDAIICLCGNSGRMPKSVREALRDAAIMGGFCKNEAEVKQKIFSDKAGTSITFWEETW